MHRTGWSSRLLGRLSWSCFLTASRKQLLEKLLLSSSLLIWTFGLLQLCSFKFRTKVYFSLENLCWTASLPISLDLASQLCCTACLRLFHQHYQLRKLLNPKLAVWLTPELLSQRWWETTVYESHTVDRKVVFWTHNFVKLHETILVVIAHNMCQTPWGIVVRRREATLWLEFDPLTVCNPILWSKKQTTLQSPLCWKTVEISTVGWRMPKLR